MLHVSVLEVGLEGTASHSSKILLNRVASLCRVPGLFVPPVRGLGVELSLGIVVVL